MKKGGCATSLTTLKFAKNIPTAPTLAVVRSFQRGIFQMNVGDWVTIIVGGATILLGWQQNRIFRQQNAIFAAQGGETTIPSERTRFVSLGRYWPTFVMVLILLLLVFDIYDRHRADKPAPETAVSASQLPTHLRLQFNAAGAMPTAIDQQNIWRWLAVKPVVTSYDPSTKKIKETSETWIIFVAFDKPVSFSQIRIEGNGSALPNAQVQDASAKTAVLFFRSDVVGTVVDITAAP